ncbi:hypothetical protein B0H63DRAFT_378950, partial [Podospora didyma]
MSDIINAIKDAVNPKRREEATVPTYDPHKRGPYPDEAPPKADRSAPTTGDDFSGEAHAKAQAETVESAVTSTQPKTTAPDTTPKLATFTNFNAPEGTYGPHSSRLANAVDPRVDSDRDGHPKHGLSDYGGAAAK